MERVKMTIFSLFVVFLALLPKMEGQPIPRIPLPPPRPLCASQFALANYACQALPYTPGTPPTPPLPPSPPIPPSPDDPDHEGRHNHQHGHRHRHRHGSRHSEITPEQENCCRWVRELDNECVCELLVRMPAFIVRPTHALTVSIDESCNVNFTCGSRLIRG